MGRLILKGGGGGGAKVKNATATASDVLSGKTFFSGNNDIKTGTMQSVAGGSKIPSTTAQTIQGQRYLTSDIVIAGDTDLTASNIKNGVNIFGVTGTYGADITIGDNPPETGAPGSVYLKYV